MKLTARHLQLIEMLSNGMTNREIALALNITEGTVKQHLFTLFKKLKAPNRAKAVIMGMQWLQQNGMNPAPATDAANAATAYLKKPVTSVVIVPRDPEPRNAQEVAMRDLLMTQLLDAARPLVQALEGRLLETHRGGIYASWGMERSHCDDLQRAWLFVRAIHLWLESNSQLVVAAAMDRAEEILGWSARDAYFSPSQERATRMARQTKPATVIVSEACYSELGPGLNAVKTRHGWQLKPENVTDSLGEQPHLQAVFHLIESAWASRTPVWIRLRGGTGRQRNRALQYIGHGAAALNSQYLRLHLPSSPTPATLAEAVYTQLDAQARLRRRPQGNKTFYQYSDTSTAKTCEAIKLLSLRGPLILGVSGHHTERQWQELMQSDNPAAVWPDCPVVCLTEDDRPNADETLIIELPDGSVLAWPDAHPPAEAIDDELTFLQWLDALQPEVRSIVRDWPRGLLPQPSMPPAAAQKLIADGRYFELNPKGQLQPAGPQTIALLTRLRVSPAGPAAHN